jgi:hypothetical protein
LLASLQGSKGPFSICEASEAFEADIALKLLREDITNAVAARVYIEEIVARKSGRILWLFLPKQTSFAQFDGIVVYRGCDSEPLQFVGYQCKYNRKPSGGAKPEWMRSCILIRGNAPDNNSTTRGWNHWNREEVVNFLGNSLGILYPASLVSSSND